MNTNTIPRPLRPSILLILLALGASLAALRAQVPNLINYQGCVVVSGVNFDSATVGQPGQFKFALVDQGGPTVQATGTAQRHISLHFIVSATVTNPGYGYVVPPAVTFSGGSGGSGAAATAVLTNARVTSITITNAGSGYFSNPIVTIAPPPLGNAVITYWSHDGTSTAGSQTTAAVSLPVFYVNSSSSGQCSFVGEGSSIALGDDIAIGTVLHELGHIFNLSHTHSGAPNCATFNPVPPLSSYLGDGDGLPVRIPDYVCFSRDQLSMASFGNRVFADLNVTEQAAINTSWLNVMSYHQEDQLLDAQMDILAMNANGARIGFCNGNTWFVSSGSGSDGGSGSSLSTAFATVTRALEEVASANDVVLLVRSTGTYTAPPGGIINTPCTLRAAYGAVSIIAPQPHI